MSKPKAQYFNHPSEFIFGLEPETKHTPGPWSVSPTAGHETHGQSAVCDESGKSIAIVYDGKANAALIAAAPELVDALQRCMDSIKALDENWTERHSYQHAEDLLRKIYG